MRVLVACEYSGIVRDAFRSVGHDAISCDLLPTEAEGPHYQGDLFDVIDYPFDLAVFHPPCTDLAVSGARHFEVKRLDGRQHASVAFFMQIVRRSHHIPKTVIEQPISIMSSLYRKPDQVIQPWQFGHAETKATCLWVKGLPLLVPTHSERGDLFAEQAPKERIARVHLMPPSPTRWKDRSRTYQGIASAMADQWGREQRMAA